MAEVFAEKVPKDKSYAVVRAGNVNIRFEVVDGEKIKVTNKWKPEARVHNSAECDVPHGLFVQACRMAAAILLPNKKQKSVISLQPSLFEAHQ